MAKLSCLDLKTVWKGWYSKGSGRRIWNTGGGDTGGAMRGLCWVSDPEERWTGMSRMGTPFSMLFTASRLFPEPCFLPLPIIHLSPPFLFTGQLCVRTASAGNSDVRVYQISRSRHISQLSQKGVH